MRGILLMTVLAVGGCQEDAVDECPAPVGSSGTCAEACDNLFGHDCQVGDDRDGCAAICAAAIAGLSESVAGRVLSCYTRVDSCAEIDGCSRTCGSGDGPVPFEDLDGGVVQEHDAGSDSGVDGGP
jgi:hypothetical protein